MRLVLVLVVVGVFASSAACAPRKPTNNLGERSVLDRHHLLNLSGIWQSDGYGYVIEFSPEAFRFFHWTPQVCVEADVGDLWLADVFDRIRVADSRDIVLLSTETEPHEIAFHRKQRLPKNCLAAPPNTIPATVEAVLSFMKTHYAFFEVRGVDWSAASARLRAKVPFIDSDIELFDALRVELASLGDAHVELEATIEGKTHSFDADPGLIRNEIIRRASQHKKDYRSEFVKLNEKLWTVGIGEDLLGGKGESAGNDRIRFGMATDAVGYLALKSMGGFVEQHSDLTEAQTFEKVLGRAMQLFGRQKAKAVIVDLSINSGGYDYIARQLVERFARRPTPAYSIFAADAKDKLLYNYTIQPTSRSAFHGEVFVLASRASVSAAELALVAFDAVDSVTIVGERSRGALSTKLAKLLPNGWELKLSNQVYLDHRGNQVEGKGVTPDIAFTVFGDSALAEAHQIAVKKVIEIAEAGGGS